MNAVRGVMSNQNKKGTRSAESESSDPSGGRGEEDGKGALLWRETAKEELEGVETGKNLNSSRFLRQGTDKLSEAKVLKKKGPESEILSFLGFRKIAMSGRREGLYNKLKGVRAAGRRGPLEALERK